MIMLKIDKMTIKGVLQFTMNKISRPRFMAGTRPHRACTFTGILIIINWIRDISLFCMSPIRSKLCNFFCKKC